MEDIFKDDSLYQSFLELLPEELALTDEKKKEIFDLFVKIAYNYFMEQI
jgi:hypothetical protein